MENRKYGLLRITFLVGAITDTVALVGMLVPSIARLLWGIGDETYAYRIAMGLGASLMLGWTFLLVWAFRKPYERRFVAPLTMVVICGFVLTEILGVISGSLDATQLILTWSSQLILLILFGAAYHSSS